MNKPATARLAAIATAHCLAGCALGETLGLVLAMSLGWSSGQAIVLAVALAFLFGYSLTGWSLVRRGVPLGRALAIAVAADTLSIATMEVTDNAFLLAVPGAMEAGLADPLFWASLAGALGAAFIVAWPVNFWLLRRGGGHACAHAHRRHAAG